MREMTVGHTRMEILRKLKRAIAREVFNNLPRSTLIEPRLEIVHAAA